MGERGRGGPGERLAAYRAKRAAGRTPEPFGAAAASRPRLFVVQKHAARALHFDLRLELDGVLLSWAVPKGPSLDPQDKRLAMHVEDHPVEYADFEGIIPEGNYGAGAVILWDRGCWREIDGPGHGLDKGKLLFDLEGHKLRGRWTLFRLKSGPKEWLLVKKPDVFADAKACPPETSVLSGLTVEQLRDGAEPAVTLRDRLARLGAPRRPVDPRQLEPMLAEPRDAPFSRAGWLFEVKHDGYRVIAARSKGRPFLRYRRGQEVTSAFPEIALALGHLPFDDLVLDAELVVADAQGRSSFQRLQRRVQIKRRADVERATVELPATLWVFDLLAVEGFDLRGLPLIERKALLRDVLPAAGALRFSEHFEQRGVELYAEVVRLGFEGIVAKRANAPYRAGRSPDWIKVRVDRTGDFAVVGYSPPGRGRSGFGALHLALRDGGAWVYAGRVGTGFDGRQLDELKTRLDASIGPRPELSGELPREPGHVWVEPRLVAEVRYKEWTRGGSLRHPVFLRLRDDKPVEECAREAPAEPDGPPPAADWDAPARREVRFTNLDKVFWPEEGYTKGDLIEYYRSVAEWILPYLRGRPLVLTRYPDGIHGKSFFQKDAPVHAPDWARTETMWSEHAQREIRYFVCDDVQTLTYLANLGTIPLHVWSSRVERLQHPDWSILDLDPKEAPFADVVRVARKVHELCREIGLDCYVKSSGSSGLHVLLPLGGQCTYEQSRGLAELLARVVAAELPEVATIARSIPARRGRVYLDYLQNGHGKLLVAPFSVRPLSKAPVSAPLDWKEVNGRLRIDRHNLRSVPARMRRRGSDPLAGLLGGAPDLEKALTALGRWVGKR